MTITPPEKRALASDLLPVARTGRGLTTRRGQASGDAPGVGFWHLVAGRAGPTGRHPRPIRVPYDIFWRWKGCSTRSERAWVSETPNPASLRLVERPTLRARAPIRSTRIESKATKQASKATGVRAFYWLGRGIIVSRQEVSGKVTYDAGGGKNGITRSRARRVFRSYLTRTPC